MSMEANGSDIRIFFFMGRPFFYVGAGLSLALTLLRQQPATALIAVDWTTNLPHLFPFSFRIRSIDPMFYSPSNGTPESRFARHYLWFLRFSQATRASIGIVDLQEPALDVLWHDVYDDVMKRNLPHSDLAFLSVCQTRSSRRGCSPLWHLIPLLVLITSPGFQVAALTSVSGFQMFPFRSTLNPNGESRLCFCSPRPRLEA